MVPELLGFEGRALLLDPDIVAVGDVYELLSRDMGGKAILCRQKPEWREGRRLYSTAVMLLDCSKLTHWQWDRDIDAIFSHRLRLGAWLNLLDESPERIGLFEDEWNDADTLTEKTKLLHNTQIPTQPWKTGLPADYHEYAPQDEAWLHVLKRRARGCFPPDRTTPSATDLVPIRVRSGCSSQRCTSAWNRVASPSRFFARRFARSISARMHSDCWRRRKADRNGQHG